MVAPLGIAVTSFLLTLQPALGTILDISHNNLFARQLNGMDSGDIPSPCLSESSCQAVVAADSCTIASCICTTAVVNAFTSCFQCAVIAGAFTSPEAESILNSLIDGCSSIGSPIPGDSSGTSGSSDGGIGDISTGTGDDNPTATGTDGGSNDNPTGTGTGHDNPTVTGTGDDGGSDDNPTGTNIGANTGAANTATAAASGNTGTSTSGGTSGSSSGGGDNGSTATNTHTTGTGVVTAAASGGTGSSPNLSAASKIDLGTLGIVVTAALGAIALL